MESVELISIVNKFNDYIKQTYQVGHTAIITDEEIEEFIEDAS